jgi:hypothetical protein
LQTLVADDADIDFTAGDVLFGNRVRFGLAMNKLDSLGQLLVVIDD